MKPDELIARLDQRTATVAVVGLGYVGVPLALEAVRAGFRVYGFDVDPERIMELKDHHAPFTHVSDEDLAEGFSTERLSVSTKAEGLSDADLILICVPTPLKEESPDMTYVEQAAGQVASQLRVGQLIVLESTSYPGTTEEVLRGILEEESGYKAGVDFLLGFSPERIDPGNETFGLRNVPKIVGGIDAASTQAMTAFYSAFVDEVVEVSSPQTAEMAKLLENTYRHVNIALANEIALLCHHLGIDAWEVIDAAATKPFGFHPFYPGPGWGGHCIPIDPAYFSWRVRQAGKTAHFVELARQINLSMPDHVVERIGELLNQAGSSISGSKILVIGVTYKADVSDVRESPAIGVIGSLIAKGAEVNFHDPYLDELELAEATLHSVELTPESLSEADLVVIITDHSNIDWELVLANARAIFDTRNVIKVKDAPNLWRL